MILAWLLIIPAIGGILAWIAGGRHPDAPRWVALLVMAIDLVLALTLIGPHLVSGMVPGHAAWIASLDKPWIPQLGISFELDLDGLSLVLILLTILLGLASVVISWTESLATIWCTGHFGFSRRCSSSFCFPTGPG